MNHNSIDVFFNGCSNEVCIAKDLYSVLRDGNPITRKELLVYAKTQPNLTKAVNLLNDILENAGNSIGKERGVYRIIEKEDSIDKRCKIYTLNSANPLEYVLYVQNIERYYLHLKTSMVTFPIDMSSFMFEGVNILEQVGIYKNTELRIVADNDYQLKNLNLISEIYEIILNQKVIRFDYHPFGKNIFPVVIHPHILKEFNGRWFLFGYTQGKMSIYAIDRIVSNIEEVLDKEYQPMSVNYYRDYLNERVGVSKIEGKPVDIMIHTLSKYGHGLLVSKKFHHTQVEVSPFEQERGYGEVKLHVGINNELIIRLISLIDNVEIVAPKELRIKIKTILKEMLTLYE